MQTLEPLACQEVISFWARRFQLEGICKWRSSAKKRSKLSNLGGPKRQSSGN
jgi:hypothetical protein